MKIVVLQPLGLGDVVLTLSLVQTLKHAMPDASIATVVRKSLDEIPGAHPDVDSVIHYDDSDAAALRYINLVSKLAFGGYDVSIVCPGSLTAAVVPAGARIGRRIGSSQTLGTDIFRTAIRYPKLLYQTAGSSTIGAFDAIARSFHRTSAAALFFTDVVLFEPDKHAIERFCGMLAPLGINGPALPPVIPAVPGRFETAVMIEPLKNIRWDPPPIAIVPGSIWPTKQWGGERFLTLIIQLRKRYPEREILLFGNREESELCDSIEASVGDPKVRDTSGQISVGQLAELVRHSAVVVCNDSGSGHLASAVGTPTVTIFGPTLPAFGFVPAGRIAKIVEGGQLPCRPCGPYGGTYCPVGTHACMSSIPVASVMNEIEKIIQH